MLDDDQFTATFAKCEHYGFSERSIPWKPEKPITASQYATFKNFSGTHYFAQHCEYSFARCQRFQLFQYWSSCSVASLRKGRILETSRNVARTRTRRNDHVASNVRD